MNQNPWRLLPRASPYVLDEDRASIDAFNRTVSPDYVVHTELLPEPYFGRRDAPVVVLALNPGFSDADVDVHGRVDFHEACRANIDHLPSAYPLLYLDPRFETTPGGAWWLRKLKPLLDAGVERSAIAANLLCVEWFPYHSKRFKKPRGVFPSQRYGFGLVEDGVRRNAIVIDMRSSRLWTTSVPCLASHARRYRLKNPRNVTVSRKNLEGDFDEVVRRLSER
jgi:hypothetical protein